MIRAALLEINLSLGLNYAYLSLVFLGKSGIFLFQKELNPGGGADDETIDVDVSKSLRVEINIPSAFFPRIFVTN